MSTENLENWKYFNKKVIGLTCVAFNGGQPRPGVDLGPEYVLQAGLIDQLKDMDFSVHLTDDKIHTYEDIIPAVDEPIGILKRPRAVGLVNKVLSNQVYTNAIAKWIAVQIGGDHSMAIGTISGVAKAVQERFNKDLKVIWVDAHADINSSNTTETGNIHGMPVSFLLGLEDKTIEGFEWVKPCLKAENLVYIGLRDVDKGEKEILKRLKIKAFSMHEVDRYGIGKVMELALEHLSKEGDEDSPIHLSFDIDALDPTVASSTGTPVRGGLTFREGHYVCEALHATGRLVGIDMVELNPSIGDNQEDTIRVGCSLIRAALGETLL